MDDLQLDPLSKAASAQRLKLTRAAFGLGSGVFATRAGIGKTAYSNYENGKRLPELDAALRLCERYELTLDWIYRGDPSGLKYALAEKINELRRQGNKARKK